jgi:pyruvate formate lyase activating enzyme
MKECLNYKILDKDKVKCETCHHYCIINEGTVGICGIRQNLKGKLYLLTYGKTVAANIDPIEKKPLFHFLPGSKTFSFGTLGCNFRCANCQNYDISQVYGEKGRIEKYDSVYWGNELSPEDAVELAIKHGCRSISYTYNEPTIFVEYALDTMILARKAGLKNVWVSNGYMSDLTLDQVTPYLDAINIDIKSFDDEFYRQQCGAKLLPVLDNCLRLFGDGVWLEITTLIIPTMSDQEGMLRNIANFIKNEMNEYVPWHLSAFSGEISWKLQDMPNTTVEKIKLAYEIGKEAGLKYVYTGNIPATDSENTYCSNCGQQMIKRSGYKIFRDDELGKCKNCGEYINGRF